MGSRSRINVKTLASQCFPAIFAVGSSADCGHGLLHRQISGRVTEYHLVLSLYFSAAASNIPTWTSGRNMSTLFVSIGFSNTHHGRW